MPWTMNSKIARGLVIILTITWASICGIASAKITPPDQPKENNPLIGPHLSFERREILLRQTQLGNTVPASEKDRHHNVELGGTEESSITVNPTDSMNLAYASLYELRVSNDGGISFEDPIFCEYPPTHQLAGDPVVAFDAEGRLFWVYLGWLNSGVGMDIFLAQCHPETGEIMDGYPVNASTLAAAPGTHPFANDKPWVAIDTWQSSPHKNNIYLVWTLFYGETFSGTVIAYTRSTDQGITWSEGVEMDSSLFGLFDWPAHVAVASNGDVYCAHHANGFYPSLSPVRLTRSQDGGQTFSYIGDPYPNGEAYLGDNYQQEDHFPGATFWWQGSFQPWVLPDPHDPAKLSIVICADPEVPISEGDDGDIFIVNSTDFGQTWTPRHRVDSGPEETLQIFPAATIDPDNGYITVSWLDNRNGLVNENGNFLFDNFAAVSLDGGHTFQPDFRINDESFDPDKGTTCRYDCGTTYLDCWVGADGSAFACGENVVFWNGQQWSDDNSTGFLGANSIWGVAENQVWAVGDEGLIEYFDGTQWSLEHSGVPQQLNSVSGRSATDIFAVGDEGIILHWDGNLWAQENSSFQETLWECFALEAGKAWAVGDSGTVLENTNGEWLALPPLETQEMLWGCWASANDDLWVAGINGGIYRWNGEAWNILQSGVPVVTSIFGTAPDDVFFSAIGEVWHWDGTSFSNNHFCSTPFYCVQGNNNGLVFATGMDGKIARFDGQYWDFQANPGLPDTPTLRIGEYNELASNGAVTVATFVGNRRGENDSFLGPQTLFAAEPLDYASSVSVGDATSVAFLESGQPNPFRWITRFSFSLPENQDVKCGIYNLRGHLVTELLVGPQPSGEHSFTWDGRDQFGQTVAGGIYFLKMETGGEVRTRKLTLMR